MKKIRVIVLEDHPLMLEAVVGHLKKHAEIQVMATLMDGSELFNLVRQHRPDVVLLDLSMPNFDPVASVKTLRREHPEIRCIVLTADTDPYYIHIMLDAGAWGYLFKSDELAVLLGQAVVRVHAGRRFFSPSVSDAILSEKGEIMTLSGREIQVLSLVARGYQNGYIAQTLGLSRPRVCHLLTDIYMKLGIQENDQNIIPRVVAIQKAQQMGLLSTG